MAKLYGAGAYTGKNPIGGGEAYVSPLGYRESLAKFHPEKQSDLELALKSAKSDQLIFIPDGVTITIGAAFSKIVRAGIPLAASMSAKGGKIIDKYNVGGYMTPLFYLQEAAVCSGLTMQGPQPLSSTSGSGRCAIRASGVKRAIVENCHIFDFACGGVWFGDGAAGIDPWNSDLRNIVRFCKIHGIQRHGFGYGIGQQGGLSSFLAEGNDVYECRHLIMGQAGTGSYEVKYNRFGEAVYNTRADGKGTWYNSHQVDSHGGEGAVSPAAGAHRLVWYNDFSANNKYQPKPNVCIRGVPGEGRVTKNWTKKQHNGQDGAFSETSPNSAFTVWDGAKGTLESYKIKVDDNWYGEGEPPDDTPPEVADLNIIGVKATVSDTSVLITTTVKNAGNIEGATRLLIGGNAEGAKEIKVAAGESEDVDMQLGVSLE